MNKLQNQINKTYNYILGNCDCCKTIIGYSEYNIIKEHDTQLFICEDCYKIED